MLEPRRRWAALTAGEARWRRLSRDGIEAESRAAKARPGARRDGGLIQGLSLDRARQAVGRAAPRTAPADPEVLHHAAATVPLDHFRDRPAPLVLARLADHQH